MGIFSSLSSLGNSTKTKFADEDFRDKLNGIGSILQGDDKAYETYTKRKAQRGAADEVANAIANGQMPQMAMVSGEPESDLGQVKMPTPHQLATRLYGRPNLPMLAANGQPTFVRRF